MAKVRNSPYCFPIFSPNFSLIIDNIRQNKSKHNPFSSSIIASTLGWKDDCVNIEFIESGQVLTIKLKGELDHHGADQIRDIIDEKIRKNNYNKLVIDFHGLDFIDSSGIGFIIGRYKLIRKRNGVIEIINASTKVRRILDMSGIGKIINIIGG